jgi:hypothetical protein
MKGNSTGYYIEIEKGIWRKPKSGKALNLPSSWHRCGSLTKQQVEILAEVFDVLTDHFAFKNRDRKSLPIPKVKR